MVKNTPRVSVVMSVYNGEKYLQEAIESILNQTFNDFEFIIIDDGSVDGTAEILEHYQQQDHRIRVYAQCNQGLAASLNRGVKLAQGVYIARMDADDISLPERFDKQVKFMDAHPEIGISGTWVETIGTQSGQVWRYPEDHESIYSSMLFDNTIAHPTVFMRRMSMREHNLEYDLGSTNAEDYDLWIRALSHIRFANIPEVLLYYRCHPSNTDKLHGDDQKKVRSIIHRRLLSRFGVNVTNQDLALHDQIGDKYTLQGPNFLKLAHLWLIKLTQTNQKEKVISQQDILVAELGKRWTQICMQSQATLLTLLIAILSSPLPFQGSSGIRKIWLVFRFFVSRIKYASGLCV